MPLKLRVSYLGMNTGWGFSRTGCRGRRV